MSEPCEHERGEERLSVQMAREHVAGRHQEKRGAYCYRCQWETLRWDAAYWQLMALTRKRVWFRRPQRSAYPKSPLWIGNDECGRHALVIGWPFTGQAIIALRKTAEARSDVRDLELYMRELDRWEEIRAGVFKLTQPIDPDAARRLMDSRKAQGGPWHA